MGNSTWVLECLAQVGHHQANIRAFRKGQAARK